MAFALPALAIALVMGGCGRIGYPAGAQGMDAGTDGAVDASDSMVDSDVADSAPDGSPDAAMDCRSLPNGTACDDRNVCTPSSSCVDGACVPAVSVESCMLASSRDEFAMEQGVGGWWYGYWHEEVDTDGVYDPDEDFVEMRWVTSSNAWRPPDFAEDTMSPGFSWCYLAPYWEHPGGGSVQGNRKQPVRRWVSDVSGPAAVELTVRMSDTSGGDGIVKRMLVDGALVWELSVDGTDGTPHAATVDVTLEVGTRIDFALSGRNSDAQDTTNFEVLVRSP